MEIARKFVIQSNVYTVYCTGFNIMCIRFVMSWGRRGPGVVRASSTFRVRGDFNPHFSTQSIRCVTPLGSRGIHYGPLLPTITGKASGIMPSSNKLDLIRPQSVSASFTEPSKSNCCSPELLLVLPLLGIAGDGRPSPQSASDRPLVWSPSVWAVS